MAIKEQITVRVSSTDVVTYPADADFTTDAIEWSDFRGFALNVWFPVLNGTSPAPTIDIEVSNSTDVLSFTKLNDAVNVPLPELFTKSELKPNFIRFVYSSLGVGALSTITFELKKLTL